MSSTVSSNGRDVATPCPFPTPFRLFPGVNGIAVQHFGAGAAYTAGTGVGLPYASTAEMTFRQGGSSNPPIFGGTQNAPRVMNCSIHYSTVSGFARATQYGEGCGGLAQYQSWYESFPAQTFDLGGTAATPNGLLHVASGSTYTVIPTTGAWFTPTSAPLALANESVSAALPLGFTFPFALGAPTTQVFVCDNGYLWLQPGGIADFTPAVNELLAQGPRLAPLWTALTPSAGSIHFDVDPNGTIAYVTWLNVPATGTGAAISMQVALFANGDFEYRYGAETISTLGTFALAGVSTGGGALDPGNRDVSATLPFVMGPDMVVPDLELDASARPVIGTTVQLVTTNAPAAAAVGVTFLSFTKIDPGIDLGPFGMPDCSLYANLDVALTTLVIAGSGSVPFAIPNNPALAGLLVAAQSGVLHPPANPLGLISSNGLELVLDLL